MSQALSRPGESVPFMTCSTHLTNSGRASVARYILACAAEFDNIWDSGTCDSSSVKA
jgi:hypothetical protein